MWIWFVSVKVVMVIGCFGVYLVLSEELGKVLAGAVRTVDMNSLSWWSFWIIVISWWSLIAYRSLFIPSIVIMAWVSSLLILLCTSEFLVCVLLKPILPAIGKPALNQNLLDVGMMQPMYILPALHNEWVISYDKWSNLTSVTNCLNLRTSRLRFARFACYFHRWKYSQLLINFICRTLAFK